MIPRETYVFQDCYRVDLKTGEVTDWLMIFICLDDGSLWPTPVAGGPDRNCSKMPEGEGMSTKYRTHMREAARTN